MRFAFIEAEKVRYPVQLLCRVLEVSRAGFYAWSKRPESDRAIENRRLVTEIHAIHAESRQTYGSPRVHAELRARGHNVGKNRVARLMSENGIEARRKKRFRKTTDSRHAHPIADNIVADWLANDATLSPLYANRRETTGRHWIDHFGDVDNITDAAALAYRDTRLRDVQGTTVRKELSALRRFIAWLRARGELPHDACAIRAEASCRRALPCAPSCCRARAHGRLLKRFRSGAAAAARERIASRCARAFAFNTKPASGLRRSTSWRYCATTRGAPRRSTSRTTLTRRGSRAQFRLRTPHAQRLTLCCPSPASSSARTTTGRTSRQQPKPHPRPPNSPARIFAARASLTFWKVAHRWPEPRRPQASQHD